MTMIERVYIFVGCVECPYSWRSHYGTYLYCRFNPNISKGTDAEHDISSVKDYPDYCWFDKKFGDF